MKRARATRLIFYPFSPYFNSFADFFFTNPNKVFGNLLERVVKDFHLAYDILRATIIMIIKRFTDDVDCLYLCALTSYLLIQRTERVCNKTKIVLLQTLNFFINDRTKITSYYSLIQRVTV